MARLNRATFGRRGSTNVISFPVDVEQTPSPAQLRPEMTGPDTPGPSAAGAVKATGPLLGEVVLSLETTRREAKEFGWTWRELLDFYVIHGILHLVGYDHEDPESEAAMNGKAWELMSLLYPGRAWSDEF